MPTKPKPRKRAHQPLKAGANRPRLAMALAAADQVGLPLASEKFSIAIRTLSRYRAIIAQGKDPELASLVQASSQHVVEATRDLLNLTLETYLERMRALAATANHAQAALIFEKLAEVKLTRESLANGHAESSPVSNQTVAVNTGPIFQIVKPSA